MKYQLLSKLYYEDQALYASVYHARITGENCVRLDFRIHGYDAFYSITPQLHDLYIKIWESNADVLTKMGELPVLALEQFARRSLIEEIILTNNIEGVYSTRKEIGDVLESLQNGGRQKRFYGLVNKYLMLSMEEIPLKTPADIRKIYDDLVLREVVADDPHSAPDGVLFRKEGADVTSPTQKVIHTGVYPEKEIIAAMEYALRILNGDRPAIERIAVFHYLFGYIHPFYDGNGRTSRFISSYLLSKTLQNPLIGYRISYTVKEQISAYYEAFKICNDLKNCGDITPFLLMFMQIVYTSMQNLQMALSARIRKLADAERKMRTHSCFQADTMREFARLLIQARLFSGKGISKKELAQNLQISIATVDARLRAVKEAGLLTEQRMGRFLYFMLDVDKL